MPFENTDSLNVMHMTDSTSAGTHTVEHLTFDVVPDSTLGAYFAGHKAPIQPTAEALPPLAQGLCPLPKDSVFLAGFRTLWNPEVRRIAWEHESVPWQPQGIAGDPLDYRFRNDDYVTSGLVLNFLLIALVVARSWRFLKQQMEDFFYTRERPNLFNSREDNVLQGRGFMILQTCLMLGILFFGYVQKFHTDVFAQSSPYTILGAGTAATAIYYLLKIGLYRIVNDTFFAKEKCRQWEDTLLISILATGCGLLPIVLATVFFDLPADKVTLIGLLLLALVKSLLLYKCHHIFFRSTASLTHLILYFCALEISPIIMLSGTLFWMGNNMGMI